MMDPFDGPTYFVEYCKRWEEAAKADGETVGNTDLCQIVMWYKRLYDSDKPNLEEIDELLEFLNISTVGQ